ncbi:MAG: hypothetical protein JEY79_16505 [Pseudodesulfovibrio sp.]|nr:hypothetical protein [Pseudodesulfovibrio sp.]
MNKNINKIEESILRMTAVVRQDHAAQTARSFGEETNQDIKPLGWWVLVCGDHLDQESFNRREKTRERLLEEVRKSGVILPENIWVWDEAGAAQLVLSTVPTLKRAERLARHLRAKGLTIRIRREDI